LTLAFWGTTMRKARYFVVSWGLVTAGATMWVTGCGQFYEQCIDTGELCISNRKPNDKPVCDGTPFDIDPATNTLKAFSEACSIFAYSKATDSSPDGTRGKPFNSLNDAVNQGTGKWVIACSDASFDESVTTSGNVQVYGGFSCANLDWKLDETTKTELAPSAPTPNKSSNIIALTMENGPPDNDNVVQGVTVVFQNFAIKVPSATAPGGSSIGVVIEDKVTAEFVNCDVTAGDGQPGVSAEIQQTDIPGGSQPAGAANGCSPPVAGTGATTTCPNGDRSQGGDGGRGGDLLTDGGKAQSGKDSTDPMGGKGGKAATDTSTNLCAPGQPGVLGERGADGPGGAEFGVLSLTGITGGDGTPGTDGKHGHGGGGGGGAFHGVFCSFGGPPFEGPGASGGGGGSGGCGGKGGGAGQAGGSSIGIISLNPGLKLTDVTLTTGKAGNGGDGTDGSSGGAGGRGGLGGNPGSGSASTSKEGCAGGDGGAGGPGGSGGGGRGGHSIGVLFKATPAMPPVFKAFNQGMFGSGGSIDKPISRPGGPGQLKSCWDLSSMNACSP
jgi:hypothetical protein